MNASRTDIQAIPVPDCEDAAPAVARKAARKLLPLLFLCYVVACLDRSNIGVAALTMMSDLGLNPAQFGFAAGVFFFGYIAGAMPANLLQVFFGPRRWLGGILIAWGIIACGMALVVGPRGLYLLRVILGLAEAGFVPGAITYLAFWFPAAYRARAFAFFTMAIPASMVIGAPVSAALLYMDGIAGLHGWQWLFVIEGIPAVILGFACVRYLPDSPHDAAWLDEPERTALVHVLDREPRAVAYEVGSPIRAALKNWITWQLGLICAGLTASSYAVVFFIPQIVAGFGGSHLETGLLSAVPFLVALFAMYFWSRHSDQTGERRWHIALPFLLAFVGLITAGVTDSPWLKMAALMAVCAGSYMSTPPFLQFIPTYFRSGKNAATASGIIMTIASLSGFLMPTLIGTLKQLSGDYRSGLVSAGVLVGLAGLLSLRMVTPTSRSA
jgi:MFS family permease